jgi:CDGSH-type Zn-finger protein
MLAVVASKPSKGEGVAEGNGLRITVSQDGPYVVSGGVPLARQIIDADEEGNSRDWRQGQTYEAPSDYNLCRCGNSRNKPFCDGSHLRVGFDGSESEAARSPYAEQAVEYDGPERALTDAKQLCIGARFCDPNGTVWRLVARTDDESVGELFDGMVGNCPSGRLISWNRRTAEAIEPSRGPAIGVVEDPQLGVSGPLWVTGGIRIESGSDGYVYESRARVTLCRCGQSSNKPFCDGTHAAIGFRDDFWQAD